MILVGFLVLNFRQILIYFLFYTSKSYGFHCYFLKYAFCSIKKNLSKSLSKSLVIVGQSMEKLGSDPSL